MIDGFQLACVDIMEIEGIVFSELIAVFIDIMGAQYARNRNISEAGACGEYFLARTGTDR